MAPYAATCLGNTPESLTSPQGGSCTPHVPQPFSTAPLRPLLAHRQRSLRRGPVALLLRSQADQAATPLPASSCASSRQGSLSRAGPSDGAPSEDLLAWMYGNGLPRDSQDQCSRRSPGSPRGRLHPLRGRKRGPSGDAHDTMGLNDPLHLDDFLNLPR